MRSFELLEQFQTMRRVPLAELEEIETSEPIVIDGALQASRAFAIWDHVTLSERYGGLRCQISDDSRPGYVDKASVRHQSLREYIAMLATHKGDGRDSYLFHTFRRDGNTASVLSNELVSDAAELLELMGFESQLFRLYIGPQLCGALPHAHGSAANALVCGRKRWVVYHGTSASEHQRLVDEAYRDYPPGAFAVDWFADECERLRERQHVALWECIQNAGDVVAIPGGMLHAVLNLSTVMGLITEELE